MPSPSELERLSGEPPRPIPPGSVVEYACRRRESAPHAPAHCPDCGAVQARILVDASAVHPCMRANQSAEAPHYPFEPVPD